MSNLSDVFKIYLALTLINVSSLMVIAGIVHISEKVTRSYKSRKARKNVR